MGFNWIDVSAGLPCTVNLRSNPMPTSQASRSGTSEGVEGRPSTSPMTTPMNS